MKTTRRVVLLAGVIASAGVVTASNSPHLRGNLSGYEEPPAVSTTGNGEFRARINNSRTEISYELRYEDTEGTVTQSHIHIAQKGVNGGITVFLCSNLGNGPAGTQACPPAPATIEGTIRAADVSPNIPATAAARAQGLGTGEFDELLDAIRAGRTYVNVHTTTFPGGEIRSQISSNNHDDDGHNGH